MGGDSKSNKQTEDAEIIMSCTPEVLDEYKFIYKDTEYDCTEYARNK